MSTLLTTTTTTTTPTTTPNTDLAAPALATAPTVPVAAADGRAGVDVATGRGWLSEHGAATAEYAIVIMAAVGFAGLLVVIMRSD